MATDPEVAGAAQHGTRIELLFVPTQPSELECEIMANTIQVTMCAANILFDKPNNIFNCKPQSAGGAVLGVGHDLTTHYEAHDMLHAI